jgi:hypothetical protein
MAVNVTSFNRIGTLTLALAGLASAGCGEFVRQGRAPAQVVVVSLQAASGARPAQMTGTLQSDVLTTVKRSVNGQQVDVPTVFSDSGLITMSLILKDPGQPGLASTPSAINQVTFTRYRVTYQRSDGRNTPGVDVPYPFDGAVTFTVPAEGSISAGFEIVRHVAKDEAPLRSLTTSGQIISTIAEVTFWGRDQAGNEVQASASILIDFGNFGDPA